MSVTSIALDKRGAVGELTSNKREYSANYLVFCNDIQDGPQVVLDYFTANEVNIGDTYAFGNDSDSSAICTSISHEGFDPRSDAPVIAHRVVCKYSTDDVATSGGIDTNGDRTTNPLDFRPDIQTGYQMVQRPCWEAIYRSGFTGGMAGIFTGGESIIPMSSAWGTFDPPLEREIALQRVSITVNTQVWNNTQANLFINTVNQFAMTLKNMADIGYPDLIWFLDIDKATAKLNDYKPVIKREHVEISGVRQTIDYIAVTAEILIDPDGWLKVVPDADWHRKAAAGDPNGRGGTISMTDLVDGMAKNEVIRGPNGDLAARKVLLNGDGQPINGTAVSDVVWLKYQTVHEKNLNVAPIVGDVFQSP